MTEEIEKAGREAASAAQNFFGAPRPALAPYPKEFYIVHKLFVGKCFPPCGVWGDLGDGPVATMEDVVEVVRESCKGDPPPSRSCLRVWHVTDERAIDRTRDALAALAEHEGE